MKIDRRNFMQFIAGGAIGSAACGLSLKGVNRVRAALASEERSVPDGAETWALSNCSLCPAACGLRVRSIGKRAVRVQGNPLHPVSRGGLCPKGLAALQELYHPDRLRRPRRNIGTRAEPKWRDVSWDEAIGVIVRELSELRAARKADSLALVDRDDRSLSSRLLRRFLEGYGSPHYLVMPSGTDALQTALYWQQGVTQPLAFSWENTRYVLSFGVDLLEGWGPPAAIMRAFGQWRDSAAGRRTKLVQVEPRLSATAARADEWIAARPGTEATLALGIAYVLITEGLCDTEFLRDHTSGFDDWRDESGKTRLGFRSLVLSDYRLADVAAATQVPPETILRLARELAANRPAVAIGDRQTSTLPGDPFAAMAIHSLNALLGSIDVPGGILAQQEVPLTPPALAPARFGAAGALPNGAGALLVHDADPVFALAGGRELLSKIPFLAAFTPFWNDTAEMCDVVLPTPTALEQWQAALSPRGFPSPLMSLAAPVVSPRHQTRPATEVFLDIARRLRGPVAAALPFETFERFLKDQVAALNSAQTGSVFNNALEESWNRMLDRSGWWAPTWSSSSELWDQMLNNGGWWEPSYPYGQWERVFRTKSGRFEFCSRALEEWALKNPAAARAAGLEPGNDRSFLPHQPRIEEPQRSGFLLLMPFEVLPLAGGSGSHLPYLQQIAGCHLEEAWESWIEIHPETAAKLKISDGDIVWLHSRRGRAQVRARCYAGVSPDIVCLPVGYGHTAGGEWSRRGVNPMSLVETKYEPVSGLPRTWNTYVRVYRL